MDVLESGRNNKILVDIQDTLTTIHCERKNIRGEIDMVHISLNNSDKQQLIEMLQGNK